MMKVYSWNVYCYNREVPKVAAYIEQLDFDVLCLQEVTPELLELLRKMPFHLAYHIDVIRLFWRGRREHNYVAILSKQPPANTDTLQFFDFSFPIHTRAFIVLMSFFKWSFVTERGALYIDVPYGDRLLRVFSVHLTLWGPSNRNAEYDAVAGHIEPGQPTVVCGDFNIIEYGPMKILNWLLGAPLKEGMPWYPERDLFEERFLASGLTNPLRGKVTHPFSRSQLDHILTSRDIEVTDAQVHPDGHGSDHLPVSVAITPAR